MHDPYEHTNRVIRQGQVLVKVFEGLEVIEPTGLIERVMVAMLLGSYRQRLRFIIKSVPTWTVEEGSLAEVQQVVGERR